MENQQNLTDLKEKHYKYVLEEDLAAYFHFKTHYLPKTWNDQITYYDCGQGPLILLLPGSTGRGISYFEYLTTLSASNRVIAIDYPQVSGIDSLVKILEAFASDLELIEITLVGHSFGAVVAQVWVDQFEERFKKLILFNGESKTENLPPKIVKSHTKSLKRFIRSVKFLSYSNFRKRFAKKLRKSFLILPDNISLRLFWEGLYEEILYTTPKDQLLSNYAFMLDFWEHHSLSPQENNSKVMIIESYKDNSLNIPEKRAIQEVYPHAQLIVLEGDSVWSLIKHRAKVCDLLLELPELKAEIE